jgi:hypothetical protein
MSVHEYQVQWMDMQHSMRVGDEICMRCFSKKTGEERERFAVVDVIDGV